MSPLICITFGFSQVVFRAKRGISYMGDLVIDDVSFLHCSPPLPSDQPCTPEQYACANGHCIPEDNLCDFINHCGDNSDEDHYICSETSSKVRQVTPWKAFIFRSFDSLGVLFSFRGIQRALQL